jgi:putative DNA primase/helicase
MSEVYRLEPMVSRGPTLVSVCASEVTIEPIEWLWPGRLAVGKHTCIAGEPGASKSQLTMDIAARISMASEWPCGEGQAPQGSTIILSAEDGAADTIAPRLLASGADLGRIHIVTAVREGKTRRSFNLQLHLLVLEREVERVGGVRLIVIDPVSSYMGKTDSHKNSEVRGVLEPIGEFAERLRVAVLSVTHFSKAGAGANTKALHRFVGSIAVTGAPRVALAVVEDTQNDRRLLLHAKNNLALPPQGLAYRIQEKIVGDVGRAVTAPYVVWDREHVAMTANEALAADATIGGDSSASAEAENFLRELLAEGPVAAKQIRADVEAAALSWSTIKRAKVRLGIKAEKVGMDAGWTWSLPRREPSSPEGAHV